MLLVIGTTQLTAAQPGPSERDKPLENTDVVAMAKAGIGESVILAAIQYAPRERLANAPEALASLKGEGVTEAVVSAIVSRVESRTKAAAESTARREAQPSGPKSPAEVKLFFTDQPTEPFRELGRVSAGKFNVMGRSRKREVVDEELRKKAAELGGDAVINITEDFASVSGVAIVFEKK
jgi:hypothetical protein